MPFKKVGRGKRPYRSPSGRRYSLKQVRLYYAGGGKFPGQKGAKRRKSKRQSRRKSR